MKIITHLLCLCCLSISNNLACGIYEAFVSRRLSNPPRLLTWQEAPEDGWHEAEQEAILLATVFREDPKDEAAIESLFRKYHTSAPAAYELAKLVHEDWCTGADFVVSFDVPTMLFDNPYLYLLQIAAYQTYLPAIYELGLYHINSENIDSVPTEGLCLLKRAAQMGMHEAAVVVCEHFSIMTKRFVTEYITASCKDGGD